MNSRGWARGRLGGIRELSFATLNLSWRRKRELSLLALLVLASDAVSIALTSTGTSREVIEEFSEVWNRLSRVWNRVQSDKPSLWLQEYWAELGSIGWDFSSWGLLMLACGAIIYVVTVFIYIAAVSRIFVADLLELHCSAVTALRWGIDRVPSLSAFLARILAAGAAAVIVLAAVTLLGVAMSDVFMPISVMLFAVAGLSVLAMGATVILVPGVLIIALVISAVGPKEPIFRYTIRVMQDRFWSVLGRAYLIAAVAVSIGAMSEFLVSTMLPGLWHTTYLISRVIELTGFTVCTAGACVLYRDLGGGHASPSQDV